jgi:hypothetical protein
MSATRKRALLRWTAAVVAIVLALAARSLLEGSASMRRSDELLAKKEVPGSIALAMHAARMYVPLAPHVRRAYDRMREIAIRAELDGDGETALLAWEAIRAASRATRTLWTPYADRLAEADDHVATILAGKPPPGIDRDTPKELLVTEQRALLAEDSAPRPLAIGGIYLGIALLVIAGYRALGAFDPSRPEPMRKLGIAPPRAEEAILFGVVALGGVALMLFALGRA